MLQSLFLWGPIDTAVKQQYDGSVAWHLLAPCNKDTTTERKHPEKVH